MKCFYCSWFDESNEVSACTGCGRELARFCPACGIKYEKSAKFCMSCGGKLEELGGDVNRTHAKEQHPQPQQIPQPQQPKQSQQPQQAPQQLQQQPQLNIKPKQHQTIEIELDNGRDNSGSQDDNEPGGIQGNESFVELDFGISDDSEGNVSSNTLKIQLEPVQDAAEAESSAETENSESVTSDNKKKNIDVKTNPDKTGKGNNELDLQFENKVIEQRKRQKERQNRNTFASVENEKSATDFITKWEPAKDLLRERRKKVTRSDAKSDFDKLFSELTSLDDIETEPDPAPKEDAAQNNDYGLFENEAGETKAEKNEKPQESGEILVEIDSSEEEQPVEVEISVSAGDSEDEFKGNDSSDPLLTLTSERLLDSGEHYDLKPSQVHETYDISFDRLISETVTEEFKDSCGPMLRKIEQKFRVCSGGLFFLCGPFGIGKGRFFTNVRKFAQSMEGHDDNSFSIVANYASIFDFDFTIFVNLVKQLMDIADDDFSQVRAKLDSVFGDTLPDSKKECLVALICLNFLPLKTKLPKYDIEYLLAYVLYCLSRKKPILWVINNANALNVRTIKFLQNLKKVFDYAPMAIVCLVDPEAAILSGMDKENIYDFKGYGEDVLAMTVFKALNTDRISAEIEKLLREKARGNILFTTQLVEYLKDLGLIFEMKGSWRFAKLPEDFVCPSDINDLIAKRVALLPEDLHLTLKEFTLLNLYSVPRSFFVMVSTTGSECLDELIKKGYLSEDGDSVVFDSASIFVALKKMIKIGKAERAFYRNVVDKLISMQTNIVSVNKHWLLLSYINLGGIIDKKMNSFLFSSAVYMEKLGFFEISQRSYQTIISSFEADETEDYFRVLPEIKNARLWRFVEPQWAKMFWDKLKTYAKQHFDYHLELLAESELLLLENASIDFSAVAGVIKKFHVAGCYEDEFRLIDKTTDILIENEEHIEANTFALRGYKLLRDVIVKSDGKGVRPAEFIYILYIRSACKLAEICIRLKNYPQAVTILEESLSYAEKLGISYFKSKIMFLLGKIRLMNREPWEDLVKEGFSNALIGMDFSILKAYFRFFEENSLENKEWVKPFLEYKNWINF